ncbi:alpha/beta fold hydrolase [Candidatus Gracilibacteria bacterium]|nr:alpha/beta fold hydrolase [Candidatus Gracilibacteria bacterium]
MRSGDTGSRCSRHSFAAIAPDLPLGAHRIAMPADADQTPTGVAHVLADLIAALDLEDVTLVGNDTGGAICQLLITQRPAHITRLVLTNCDAFEAFFPAAFNMLSVAARRFGSSFTDLLAGLLRFRLMQRLFVMPVAHRRYSNAELDAVFAPLLTDPAIRRDTTRFLAAVDKRLTLEAARQFHRFTQPVLLIWGKDDFLFPPRLGRRLQAAFPNARMELVPHARAFVPVRPARNSGATDRRFCGPCRKMHKQRAAMAAERPHLLAAEQLPTAPQQARSRQKRAALMSAALTLFSAHGYNATTVEAIAQQAGMAVGAFYQHFSSKRQLVLVLMDQLLDDAAFLRVRAEQSDPSDVRGSVAALVRQGLQTDWAYAGAYRAWRELSTHDAAVLAMQHQIEEWTAGQLEIMLGLLSRALQARPNLDLATFAHIISVLFWALVEQPLHDPAAVERLVNTLTDLIVHGLFTDAAC